jgi:hypothetical protein
MGAAGEGSPDDEVGSHGRLVEQIEFHRTPAKTRENRLIPLEKPRRAEALVALRWNFGYPHFPFGTTAADASADVEYYREFQESSRTGRPFL